MITSLAPMTFVTFALLAAVSTVGAAEPLPASHAPVAAATDACALPAARPSPCVATVAVAMLQQGAPTQEKPPQEKPDAGKKPGTGEQVRKYVDERAPKIADWLFESPRPATGLEGEPLRNRGLRSLPPVAGGHRMSNDLTVLEDLGFVIAGAEPEIVYVVSIIPAALGSPVDIRPNDVILALNGHTIDTPQSFRSRYSRLRPGQPVELRIRRGEQRLTVPFYKPSTDRLPIRAEPPGVDRPGTVPPD